MKHSFGPFASHQDTRLDLSLLSMSISDLHLSKNISDLFRIAPVNLSLYLSRHMFGAFAFSSRSRFDLHESNETYFCVTFASHQDTGLNLSLLLQFKFGPLYVK